MHTKLAHFRLLLSRVDTTTTTTTNSFTFQLDWPRERLQVSSVVVVVVVVVVECACATHRHPWTHIWSTRDTKTHSTQSRDSSLDAQVGR